MKPSSKGKKQARRKRPISNAEQPQPNNAKMKAAAQVTADAVRGSCGTWNSKYRDVRRGCGEVLSQ
jgi:hypothetical protein